MEVYKCFGNSNPDIFGFQVTPSLYVEVRVGNASYIHTGKFHKCKYCAAVPYDEKAKCALRSIKHTLLVNCWIA